MDISLQRRRLFIALGVTAVALVIASFAEAVPWIWMALIAIPLIGWYFEENCREYELALCVLLDEAASEQNLVKLPG